MSMQDIPIKLYPSRILGIVRDWIGLGVVIEIADKFLTSQRVIPRDLKLSFIFNNERIKETQ